jgi:hypothetical protein
MNSKRSLAIIRQDNYLIIKVLRSISVRPLMRAQAWIVANPGLYAGRYGCVHSNAETSPLPWRTTTGASPDRSTTLEGS